MHYEIISDEKTPIERTIRLKVLPEYVADFWKKELKRVSGEAQIPGFRKGKAPSKVVENHVGREEIWKQVRDDVAWAVVDEIVNQADKKPLVPPELDFDDVGDDTGVWKPGESLEFTMKYFLPPPTPEEIE